MGLGAAGAGSAFLCQFGLGFTGLNPKPYEGMETRVSLGGCMVSGCSLAQTFGGLRV